MKRLLIVMIVFVFFVVCGFAQNNALASSDGDFSMKLAQKDTKAAAEEEDDDDDYDDDDDFDDDDDEAELVPDPLYRMNYDFFELNNGLYFVFLEPAARAWGFIIPQEIRACAKNFMYNIRFPIRFINCILQGKLEKGMYEFSQFFVNSTVGLAGLADIARPNYPSLDTSPEDFGQTLAVWGFGNGFYLMIPILGPSSGRDAVGKVGDLFADPLFWLIDDLAVSLAVRAGEAVNDTSFRIGDYKTLLDASLDPYTAVRNAYIQHRNKLIAE